MLNKKSFAERLEGVRQQLYMLAYEPGVVTLVEHVRHAEAKLPQLHWLMLIHDDAGGYAVTSAQTTTNGLEVRKGECVRAHFTALRDARERFDRYVTLIEQRDWEYLDEHEVAQEDVLAFADKHLPYALDALSVHSFCREHRQSMAYQIPLPKGVYLYFALDAKGKGWFRYTRNPGQWYPIPRVSEGCFLAAAKLFAQGPMLFAGVLSGHRVFLTDCFFANGKSWLDKPALERNEMLASYRTSHPDNFKFNVLRYQLGSAVMIQHTRFSPSVFGCLCLLNDKDVVAVSGGEVNQIEFGMDRVGHNVAMCDYAFTSLGEVPHGTFPEIGFRTLHLLRKDPSGAADLLMV